MELSDIVSWLVVIGGALIGFVGTLGKERKSNSGRKPSSKTPQPMWPDMPEFSKPHPAGGEIIQPWQHEGKYFESNGTNVPPVPEVSHFDNKSEPSDGDHAYDYNSPLDADNENSIARQDWRKAIIFHEILKTKF